MEFLIRYLHILTTIDLLHGGEMGFRVRVRTQLVKGSHLATVCFDLREFLHQGQNGIHSRLVDSFGPLQALFFRLCNWLSLAACQWHPAAFCFHLIPTSLSAASFSSGATSSVQTFQRSRCLKLLPRLHFLSAVCVPTNIPIYI